MNPNEFVAQMKGYKTLKFLEDIICKCKVVMGLQTKSNYCLFKLCE